MSLSALDFDRVIGKLRMKSRPGKHRFAWLEHDGKQILWTERSHGRGEIGNVEYAIRRQLKVSGQQLKQLADCPMTREAYIEHLKAKGLIDQ